MKSGIFRSIVIASCLFCLFCVTTVFASSLRIKPVNSDFEAEMYQREIAPLLQFSLKPIAPAGSRSVMIQNLTIKIEDNDEICPSAEKIVLISNKSKGVDRIEAGRIVAESSYWGKDSQYVTLYPSEGDNIIDLRNEGIMTVAAVMGTSDDLNGYIKGKSLNCSIVGVYATWINGSTAKVTGFLPIVGSEKFVGDETIGKIKENESSFGVLSLEVPEDSVEDVRLNKIFINGKKKGLRIFVQRSDGWSRKFRCKNNDEVTVCDFKRKGLKIPKGTSVIITGSEQGLLYQGFNTLDIKCEGVDSGRWISVTPSYSDGKG